MQDTLRLALWQCRPAPLDVAGNLRRLEKAARRASAAGADLLVCPEMFLTGYNIGAAQVDRLAEMAGGANALALSALAMRHGLALVGTYPERAPDGRLYNAAILVDADGTRLADYRKTHLFGELDRSMFSAGAQDSPVVAFKGWRLGLLICYDVEFPEPVRHLALAGADLIVVPTANMDSYDFIPQTLVPTRAYENQLYLAYANFTGAEGDLRYGGLSCVAPPDGGPMVRADRGESLLIADLDAARLALARTRQTHLRDRRTDLS